MRILILILLMSGFRPFTMMMRLMLLLSLFHKFTISRRRMVMRVLIMREITIKSFIEILIFMSFMRRAIIIRIGRMLLLTIIMRHIRIIYIIIDIRGIIGGGQGQFCRRIKWHIIRAQISIIGFIIKLFMLFFILFIIMLRMLIALVQRRICLSILSTIHIMRGKVIFILVIIMSLILGQRCLIRGK